jgi:excinuclease UvrABC nuclease subunit
MTIEGESAREAGVYAFVVERRNIRYVGSARNLRERLRNYELTKPPYTAARVRSEVLKAVNAGQKVEVFTLDSPKCRWRGLEIDLAQGIEKSLIQRLKPDCWNIRRHAQRIDP